MTNSSLEKKAISLIKKSGPLTGSEIRTLSGGDDLALWRTCRLSKSLQTHTAGISYLRLDRRVEGFARLSPSVLREFLTYSVVGLVGDENSVKRKVQMVRTHIDEVSRYKFEIAYDVVAGLENQLENEWLLHEKVCFILAGDIVYNMAHDVLRPERSTGRLVKGSDLDLVVIVRDDVPDAWMKKLDDCIYQKKYRALVTPYLNEEIDYIVKKMARVRNQLHFDTFKHMVACKILKEGKLLYGSKDIFFTVKNMLSESGVTEKLGHLEKQARVFRQEAEERLLGENPEKIREDGLYLFYPTEESEEFE
ncbi:MAG: hypothetical protein JRJ43_06390 [Deltaproteobacteria bacterium]|nr:hypothetical protein [Deltaproteobacteria bacterium]MBW1719177.1 hypothetical protein [Deltaproteobacteria bacterium]MBW1937928.1 hypothetical protein [Deltaproteobacteria bacterium]MBW1964265.1 hypothetical protein [Deltaproteobacteria bacterium]MBW2079793.1 hypothetical protein [Deltaproteobacteria bacterium]